MHIRSFRNPDVPTLAKLWRERGPLRGAVQGVTAAGFERLVLSKPYFDPAGLLVAFDGDQPLGFVHAGFGPNDGQTDLSADWGVIAALVVPPQPEAQAVGRALIAAAEGYLRAAGAQVLYGGSIWPLTPFYLGLYGGSEMPGVLTSDAVAREAYKASGYREIDRVRILQRGLAEFRPPVDRHQVRLRRSHRVEPLPDPAAATWWEACQWGVIERVRFELRKAGDDAPLGSLAAWEMELFSGVWGARTAGLIDIEVADDARKQGLGTYLVSESLRQLATLGYQRVEAQVMEANAAAGRLFSKLGFVEVEQGDVLRKEFSG